MQNITLSFYDSLADDYHLIYTNWEEARTRQAAAISAWLSALGHSDTTPLLDCACGIGTQVLGLAQLGYSQLWGTDLSPKAIDRAKREASRLGLRLPLEAVDIRRLREWAPRQFQVILAVDNVLPHFLTDADMQKALRNIYHCLEKGGAFIATLRDYTQLLQRRPALSPVTRSQPDGRKHFTFQEWNWQEEAPIYEFRHFTVSETSQGWAAKVRTGYYRAWAKAPLLHQFRLAGFSDTQWLDAREANFYQPAIIAKKQR